MFCHYNAQGEHRCKEQVSEHFKGDYLEQFADRAVPPVKVCEAAAIAYTMRSPDLKKNYLTKDGKLNWPGNNTAQKAQKAADHYRIYGYPKENRSWYNDDCDKATGANNASKHQLFVDGPTK
jgi:hypothetical protein